jgi:signal transduction histidine kinase
MPSPTPVPRHLLAVDIALAAALLVLGEIAVVTNRGSLPVWTGMLLTAGYAAPLAVRRLAPATVAITTVGLVVALGLLDPDASQPTIPLAVALAMFTLGATTSPPRTWIVAGGLAAVLWGSAVVSGTLAGDLAVMFILYGAPFTFGFALRARGRRADVQAATAATDERARIARELHDIVAHSLSVVTLQTQAVRRKLGPDHAAEAESLRAVETTAREALVEMRWLLGAVRPGSGPLAPQPGLSNLDVLLTENRRTGLTIESTVTGDRIALGAGLDLAGYRIIQEALTNVRRHAGATRAWVELCYQPGFLDIGVRDDGAGPGRSGRSGNGLIGMRERVLLYGGELTVGPAVTGGYRVHARLPIASGEPASRPVATSGEPASRPVATSGELASRPVATFAP